MNELVAADHGLLVAARPIGTQNLSTIYTFDDADMERVIAECIAMPDARVAELSQAARAFYERNDRRFGEQLGEAHRREWSGDSSLKRRARYNARTVIPSPNPPCPA